MAKGRQATRIVISIAISLFFLYLTFWAPRLGALFRGEEGFYRALFSHGRFDLAQLWHAMITAHWSLIVAVGVLYILGLLLRAWRWYLLLPQGSLNYGQSFAAMMVGYMANNLLPLRMGEIYRAQVVWQICGLSRSSAMGTIVLERTLDLFFFLPFVAGAMLLYPLPAAYKVAGITGAVAIFILVVFLIWMVFQRQQAMAALRFVLSVLPSHFREKAITLFDKFTTGLSALRDIKLCLRLTVYSLALWILYAVVTYLMLVAMDLTGPDIPSIALDPLAAALVLLVITTIGFSTPSAPGAVGTYHGVTVLGLSLFGVPGDRAAGFAILLHAMNYLPLTGIGLFYFWQQGLSFRKPVEAEKI
ncbi:flippase-like domain-containing protein [bacterium]|nr:flippase-like domain-containing protein [bacterium]